MIDIFLNVYLFESNSYLLDTINSLGLKLDEIFKYSFELRLNLSNILLSFLNASIILYL